jgi:uncharacterized protein Yka (UPF0111/DUF47 family)
MLSDEQTAVSARDEGILRRLWHRVFPRVPDFQGLVRDQSALLESTLEDLAAFLVEPSAQRAESVRQGVARGQALAQRNLDLLHRTFVTPIDREDIYMLITRVDHVFDYAMTCIRELELLEVAADSWMTSMVASLREGAAALTGGIDRFRDSPEDAEPFAEQARQAERDVEGHYREALAELFVVEAFRSSQGTAGSDAERGVAFIIDRMKRREVYRHLSNAADRLARAGDALHDLSVKYA